MAGTGVGGYLMVNEELGLIAHLLRRAGFGATLEELEAYKEKGYEATVDELLHPEALPEWDDDMVRRYQPDMNSLMYFESAQSYWMYKMINSRRPLEEKIALFWHSLFATAYGKLNHAKGVVNQTDTFRRHGLGSFHDILIELSRDPAMIFWLDNKDNPLRDAKPTVVKEDTAIRAPNNHFLYPCLAKFGISKTPSAPIVVAAAVQYPACMSVIPPSRNSVGVQLFSPWFNRKVTTAKIKTI